MPAVEEEDPQAAATPAPSAAPTEPAGGADQVETQAPAGPAPIMPSGSSTPGDVARSFAAAGYGAPSKDYKGPALAPPGQPDQMQPLGPDERYMHAHEEAQRQWDANPDNPNRPNNGASGVEADLAASRGQTEADLSGQPYRSPDEPPEPWVRQAERQGELDERQQQRQDAADQAFQNKSQDAQKEAQMRGSGQKFYKDPFGRVQPVVDPATGKPEFSQTDWQEGVNPKTGAPALTKRDQSGQRQFKTPPIEASPDLKDDQLYYRFPDGSRKPAGKIDDLVKSPDFGIQRQALRAQKVRREDQWKQALAPMQDHADQAKMALDQAKLAHGDLATRTATLQAQTDSLAQDTAPADSSTQPNFLESMVGGTQGNPPPDPEAQAHAKALLAEKQNQLAMLNEQQAHLADQIKPNGPLEMSLLRARTNLNLFKLQARHDSYQDSHAERTAIVKQQGQDPANDPILQSIDQGKDAHFRAIMKLTKDAQKFFQAATPAAPGAEAKQELQSAGGLPQAIQRANTLWQRTGIEKPKDTSLIPESVVDFAVPIQNRILTALTTGNPMKKADPNSAWAGLAREGDETVRGLFSPQMIGVALATGGLGDMAAAGSVTAKLALRAIALGFAGQQALQVPEQARNAWKVLKDPKSTKADIAQAFAAPIVSMVFSAFALHGATVVPGRTTVTESPNPNGSVPIRTTTETPGPKFGGTPKERAQNIINDLAEAFPKAFFKNAGMSAEEFAKTYPDIVRKVARGVATPEEVAQVQKINDAAKAAGVKPGDLARGRVGAEQYQQVARETQNILPKSMRVPPKQGADIAFKEVKKPAKAPAAKPEANTEPGEFGRSMREEGPQPPKAGEVPRIGGGKEPPEAPGAVAEKGPKPPAPKPDTKPGETGVPTPPPAGPAPTDTTEAQETRLAEHSPAHLDYLKEQLEAREISKTEYAEQIAAAAKPFPPAPKPEEKSNATTTGEQPPNDQQEHQRVPRGTDLPENGPEVRGEESPQAGDRGGAVERQGAPEPGEPPARGEGEEAVRPEIESIEHLGKKELAVQGQGEPVDQYQVKLKGEEGRGRTMTKADMEKEGIDTSKLPVKPENKHGEIEGEKLDKGWTAFAPEAKGLGIPRAEMPQIHAEHRGAFVNYMKGQGVDSKPALVRPTDLKPTQNEYSPEKVQKAREHEGGDRSILVSSDNYIADGHHQWVAALHDNPTKPMKVIRLNEPIHDLLPKMRDFPSAESAKGATPAKSLTESPTNPVAKPEESPASPAASYGDKVSAAADAIGADLAAGKTLDWRDLFAHTDKAFGATQASGAYSVKDAYDAMELAVNKLVAGGKVVPENELTSGSVMDARHAIMRLKQVESRLPTQTKRTGEMDAMQQFSTPPSFGYVANWVANLHPQDVYREPSAGNGGLAAFARAAGVKEIQANELSERRAEILKKSGIADKVTGHNAEYLHALTSGNAAHPTVVVMNPPFSNGAESGKRGDTMVGARHVEDALKSLAPGGRLVAIVGEGMAFGKPTFNAWWARIQKEYNVRANIGVSGEEYRKYGTTFGNQLLVIDKDGVTTTDPLKGSVDNVAQLPSLLQGIRDARPTPRAAENPARPPVEPGGGLPVGREGVAPALAPAESNTNPTPGNITPAGAERIGRPAANPQPLGEQPGARGGGAVAPREGPAAVGPPAGNPGPSSGSGDRGTGAVLGPSTELVAEAAPGKPGSQTAIDDESVYAPYSPAKARIAGAKPHPTALVESAAMASVAPPDPKYVPNLPQEAVTQGKLSEAQLENIIYAGQAHGKILPSGERRGYFIGDGTGVGKGRQIAGIIMDNWRQGRHKAVWISKTGTLADAARADLRDLGMDGDLLTPINKAAPSGKGEVKMEKGVLFSTYTSLASGHEGLTPEGTPRRKNPDKVSRLEQMVNWLGKDFDGVLAFDEAHQGGNAVAVKTNRGMKDPSAAGIAMVDIQKLLPKARVVYVSATGATEPSNLSYADRLGIWGPGTPFTSKLDFFGKISAGGVSSMEIVARDLKAMGSYMARTLSFEGVKFSTLQQVLTPEQHAIYDKIADSWSGVFQNLDQAMAQSGAANNAQARGAARSAFFGAQQRFFNQMLTAMEMPAIIKDVHAELGKGHSAVLQLVNTNEATQEREIARAQSEENSDLEDLDLSPKDILLQYVDKSFPTTLYKEIADPNNPEGKTSWVPVTDANGAPVADPEALKKKEKLMMEIKKLELPENPLEQLLNTFGHENVAEITGRGQRIINKKQEDGTIKRQIEANRTDARRKIEENEFHAGKRRILVFSSKGGTGASYHASRRIANQQERQHYLVQAGWRADVAIQGLGRTHRSDQAQPPFYKLGSTDIQGHKRFVSTIARRMAQLGALTSGERRTTGQGLFSEKDNLESKYADDGLKKFFYDLYNGKIDGLEFGQLSKQMGFGHSRFDNSTGETKWKSSLIDEKTGKLNETKLPTIQQFLNRILALRVPDQNQVFNEFYSRMEARIDNAKSDGSFDPGTQTFKSADLNKVSDEVVYQHPDSTAETRLVAVDATDPVHFTQFEDIPKLGSLPVERYVKNLTSGRIYALKEGPPRTLESGSILQTYRRIGTHGQPDLQPRSAFDDPTKWEELQTDAAEKGWGEEITNAPQTRTERKTFVVGAFLPIWDRLNVDNPKIYRFTTNKGESMLGAMIPPKLVDGVRARLGAKMGDQKPEEIVRSIVDDGASKELANGWKLKRVRVSGDQRIEVVGPGWNDIKEFEDHLGGFTERIQYNTRFFLPAEGPHAVEAMTKLMGKSPVVAPTADDVVQRLQGMKQHKPGMIYSNPVHLAWDAALDVAIAAVKAGRKFQQVLALAKGRFRERYPGEAGEQVRRLERALAATVGKLEQMRQKGVDVGKRARDVGKRARGEIAGNPEWNDLTAALAGFEERASTGKMFIKKEIVDPIREKVPSREAREAINAWIEADGVRDLLKEWRDQSTRNPKTKAYAARYDRAMNLTDAEKDVGRQIIDRYAELLDRGQKEGFLGEGIEDFINHWWDINNKGEKFAEHHSPQLTQFFKSAMERKFPTNFEGEQAGMIPKTYDVAELLGAYMDGFNRISNTRKLIKDLTNKQASDGRPLASPTGTWTPTADPETGERGTIYIKPNQKDPDTKDYHTDFSHPALNKWKWMGEDENSNPVMLQGSLALHPEAFTKIKNAFSESAIKSWYRSEGSVAMAVPKALVHAADYLNSTAKGTALGFLSPFHQVQEGTHAIGHRVNPFQSFAPIEPWKNKRQRYAMQHGLMLGPGSRGPADFMEGFGDSHNPLYRVPGFGEQAKNYTTWLFQHYIPALKFQTWENMMERNTKLFAGKMNQDQIAFLSAVQANSAYGHLNYVVMGRNPTIQHFARLLFLSPDFTEARARFVGQAAQGAAGLAARVATGGRAGQGASRAGAEQFHALMLLALAFYMGARIANELSDGDPHFEAPFQLIHGNRSYGMRSVPEDLYRAFKDSRMFFNNRLSPITRLLLELRSGTNARGEKVDWQDSVKDAMARSIPNSVQWVPGLNHLSEYGKNSTISAWEQFAGIFGIQIARVSPNYEAFKLGDAYKKAHGIKEDTGTYPVSRYQPLRYVLEDSDLERAHAEVGKLVAEEIKDHPGMSRSEAVKKLAVGFRESLAHPYTQNEKMDEHFIKSLTGKDRAAVLKAEMQKQQTLNRFTQMMGLPHQTLHKEKH